jgi:hypothetical protein
LQEEMGPPRTPTTIRRTLFVTFVETGNLAFIFVNIFKNNFSPLCNSYLAEFLSLLYGTNVGTTINRNPFRHHHHHPFGVKESEEDYSSC